MLSGEDQHRTKATQLSPKTIIFTTLVLKKLSVFIILFFDRSEEIPLQKFEDVIILVEKHNLQCSSRQLCFWRIGSVGWRQIKTRAPAWLVGN